MFLTDTVVLASTTLIWPGCTCQVPTICDWHFQSSTPRFCCPGRHEWSSEISDPPWWSFNRPSAFRTHMVWILYLSVWKL